MNRFEYYISEFLAEYKEVSLEKIGVIKTLGYTGTQTQSVPVDFTFDKRAVTSPELADFISAKTNKSKMLIASDLESHLTQAREFLNIGKTYEIINAGFIKKNNKGEYQFLPLSQAVKAQKNFSQPVTKNQKEKERGSSAVQLFTLIIVVAIVAGLGWEAYQFFLKPTMPGTAESETVSNTDTSKNIVTTLNKDSSTPNASDFNADTTHRTYNSNDTLLVHYIFETTNLLIRAQSRTEKLKSYGSDAGYDSVANGPGKLYSLYIIKRTKVSDTLAVKDSLAKFLQKEVQIKIVSNQ